MTDAALAVLCPHPGLASETFLERHCNQLVPGATSVVCLTQPSGAAWEVQGDLTRLPETPEPHRLWWYRHRAAAMLTRRIRPLPPVPMQATNVLAGHLRRNRPNAVLLEYLDAWLGYLDVLRSEGRRVVAHAHGYDVSTRLRSPYWREQYRRLNAVDAVVTVSRESADLLADLGIRPELLHVIPCGTDVPETPPAHPPRDGVRVIAVGRLVEKKNPLATIQAFARATDATETVHLDVVGAGPLEPACRRLIEELGVSSRVTLHGALPHETILAMLAAADIFVQHSVTDPATGDKEGLPVAILEAMARALPVVSTRHAGIPEAVHDGLTGLLVAERDIDGMARGLRALVGDPARRQALGLAGWQRAQERFSWAREREDLLALLFADG